MIFPGILNFGLGGGFSGPSYPFPYTIASNDYTGDQLFVFSITLSHPLGHLTLTLSDNRGNTFVHLPAQVSADGKTKQQMVYVLNPTSSAGHQIYFNGQDDQQIECYGYGFRGVAGYQGQVLNALASGSSLATGNLTLAAGSLVVAALGSLGAAATSDRIDPLHFSWITQLDGTHAFNGSWARLIMSNNSYPSALNPLWTWTGTHAPALAAAAAFTPISAAMPNVVGMTVAAAQTALTAAGFTLGKVVGRVGTTVVSQVPAAGVLVPIKTFSSGGDQLWAVDLTLDMTFADCVAATGTWAAGASLFTSVEMYDRATNGVDSLYPAVESAQGVSIVGGKVTANPAHATDWACSVEFGHMGLFYEGAGGLNPGFWAGQNGAVEFTYTPNAVTVAQYGLLVSVESFSLYLEYQPGTPSHYRIRGYVWASGLSVDATFLPGATVAGTTYRWRLEWKCSSGPYSSGTAALDGYVKVFRDDVLVYSQSGVDLYLVADYTTPPNLISSVVFGDGDFFGALDDVVIGCAAYTDTPPPPTGSLMIAGVERFPWVLKHTLKGDWTRGGFASLAFTTGDKTSGSGAYRPSLDQEVLFSFGGQLLFRGFITDLADAPLGGIRSGTSIGVKCGDYSMMLDRVTVTKDYTGAPNQILYSMAGTPAQITTYTPHTFLTGQKVRITGHGNAVLNGDWTVTVVSPTEFTIPATNPSTGGAGDCRVIWTLHDIIADIVATYLTPNYGITLDPTMVTGPVMGPANFAGTTVTEVLKAVTDAVGYVWRVLPSKELQIFQPGTRAASFGLDGSTTNTPIQWQQSRREFTNRVIVYGGGTQKIVGTETFVHTGGPAATYQMDYPASADISDVYPNVLWADGVNVSVVGWTAAQLPPPCWYWDPTTAQLVQQIGAVNPAAGAVLTVTYTRQYPVKAIAENATDVLPPPTGRGPWESVVEAPNVTDKAQAQTLADQQLAQQYASPRELQLGTIHGYAYPNDAMTLTFADRTISGSWIIESAGFSFLNPSILMYDFKFIEGTSIVPTWIDDFQQLLEGGGGGGGASSVVTTPSVPISGGGGGGGGGLEYLGDYVPGLRRTYHDGDIVIADDGIAYICVKDGVTTPPEMWPGVGMATAVGPPGPMGPQGPPGLLGGGGTAGKISKWSGPTSLVDSLMAESGSTVTLTGSLAVTTLATPGGVVYKGASALALSAVGAAGQLLRSNGATAPDWTVGLTFDGTTLALTGNAAITGNETVTGYIGSPSYASQTSGWRIDTTGGADFRYLFVDEMHAKTFITDLEQALAGGQIIAKAVAMVAVTFTAPALGSTATLRVRDLPSAPDVAAYQPGDAVVLRAFTRASGLLNIADCVGVVTAYADQTDGTQTWTFTRNTGTNGGLMTAGGTVTPDSLAIDYGVSGNGYYEVNADDGLNAVNSPYAQIATWVTAPVAGNRTTRTRLGNLFGQTAVSGEYGLLAGVYSATGGRFLRASSQAFELHGIDLLLWDGTTNTVKLDHTTPSFAMGSPLPSAYGTGTGIWMGKDAGVYKFRVGSGASYIQWDGTNLTVVGSITVTSGNAARTDLSNVTGGYAGSSTAGGAANNTVAVGSLPASSVAATNFSNVTANYAGSNAVGGSANNTLNVGSLPYTTVQAWSYGGTTYINGGTIYTGTVYASAIVSRTITADLIAAGAITAYEIAARSISGDRIQAGTLSAYEIIARSLTADRIAAGALTAYEIAARSLTADRIAAGQVTAYEIAAESISGDRLQVHTINADRMYVTSLDALSANLGTITAGTINGITINGTTINGSNIHGTNVYCGGGDEIQMRSDGLFFYGNGGAATINMNGATFYRHSSGAVNLDGCSFSVNNGGMQVGGDFFNFYGRYFYIGSLFGAGALTNYCVKDNGDGNMKIYSSSLRYKDNVRTWKTPAASFFDLEPIVFQYKVDLARYGDKSLWCLGFAAEDLHAIDPMLATYDNEGRPEAFRFDAMLAYLFQVVKMQDARIKELERR